jgi:hypothetical protein
MLMGVSKKIEFAANVAIIIVASLLAIVLVKNYLFTKSEQANIVTKEASNPPQDGSPAVGTKLSILDLHFPTNDQTLVLAISSTCHFCSESAGFYKRIAQGKNKTRLVAVLPQPVDEGRDYLEKLGVFVDEVKQLPLESIGVQGTPTLMLLDRSGTVTKSWIGRLTPEREQTVLSAL